MMQTHKLCVFVVVDDSSYKHDGKLYIMYYQDQKVGLICSVTVD